MDAYRQVRANRGAAGIDKVSLELFEADLTANLYKLWNRLSSGSYFPPPVKQVEIPKKSGAGKRVLGGIPTVTDRIAQQVVKARIEGELEQLFHPDSYGYRPKRSAADAVAVTRERCWKYDWVVEFDIRRAFDELDWDLLRKAIEKHVRDPWCLLYLERWLTASAVSPRGDAVVRTKGVPQCSVIGPVLMNLYMHYCAPGQTWCFQGLKVPPRQELQPPHRESSFGSEEATNRTKRMRSWFAFEAGRVCRTI